ncbi:PH domain-containing protein [Staphylococcus argensis]|uniref:YdbS-like PH domain-containing protein n=1 Tax=Staphylococcus argensis TaxID=1607738 RepID=A0A2K4FCJ0_9STAP|nr:PH domain-containing protein [Staphylococcus argensis]MCY6992358.1 PH domain-containing protein [Staphylococcus argensis]POA09078.1 hypothetical protein CD039_06850 [Staphylococcus argensis]
MPHYNFMHPRGKTVMRIAGGIWSVVILLILVGIELFAKFLLHINNPTVYWWLSGIGVVIIVLHIIIYVVISPIYKYKVFRYRVEAHHTTIRRGLWFIQTDQIPHFRVQNVDTYEGIIMRKFGLADVILSTAGGNAEINLIPRDTALELKQQLQRYSKEEKDEHKEVTGDEAQEKRTEPETVESITKTDI